MHEHKKLKLRSLFCAFSREINEDLERRLTLVCKIGEKLAAMYERELGSKMV